MTVYALVLAGGQGSRLGHVRKAELRLGGRRMLEGVTERLRDFAAPLLLSVGDGPAMPEVLGLSLIDDAATGGGPLAGLAAAVLHLRGIADPGDVLVTVAVDTPFLPTDFVERLTSALERAPATFAAWQGNFYPTNAAYRFGAIADLLERAQEIGSPKRLLRWLDAVAVDWNEATEDPFANLNTLADLVALQRRANDKLFT
jgi:molybdenum cofactor guanylyltransferase